jgi:hypothetical protein
MPHFEKLSTSAAGRDAQRRFGFLFKLTKLTERPLPLNALIEPRDYWERLTLGSTQVALKIEADEIETKEELEFDRDPFVLLDTSRRNAALKTVNICTSDNIVARVRHPRSVANGLRQGSRRHFGFMVEYFRLRYEPGRDVRGAEWRHRT